MARTETIDFSVPPAIARQVERIAKAERRTKSELFREMVRVYERYRKQEEQYDEAWVMRLVRQVQEEDRIHPMTQEELEREEEELRRYGAAQAKKLGIKAKDIDRIIHEHRARRRHQSRS
jgi:predicted transcriptional regulator